MFRIDQCLRYRLTINNRPPDQDPATTHHPPKDSNKLFLPTYLPTYLLFLFLFLFMTPVTIPPSPHQSIETT